MSKQSHDQDEPQQAPGTSASAAAAPNDTSSSGAASSTAEASEAGSSGASSASEAGKPSNRGRPRGRRGGKGRHPSPRDSASSEAATDTAAASAGADRPAASKSADSGLAEAKSPESSKGAESQSPDSQSSATKSPESKSPESKASGDKSAGASGGAKASTGASPSSASAATSSASKTSSSKTSSATPSSAGKGASGGAAETSTSDGNGGGRKAGIVALVLVILLAVGVVVAGWFGWQRLEQQQQRLAQVESNREAVSALETRFEEAEQARASALDEAVASVEGEFSDYRSEVDQTLDRVLEELNSQQQTDEREWLHAEVAYLLRLANQRLQLERDVGGAMALLETADTRLGEANNPALLPVRRAVAEELAKLDAVPNVDRTGLYLSLNAQQEQLAELPLKQDVAEIAAEGSIETPPSGDWQQQLERFGSELKDLVTVRRHEQALEALITPEQESYLRQNVRLVLEQAQLALLKEEPELYRASLDKAVTLIEGYYNTEREGVQASLARLGELREVTIRPELPDISGSQQAMAHFIEKRFEAGAQGGDA
ncbi:uroporphyrinogen-III C-methyltransferase [Halomonas sp. YLGW01]|uniref:uroporphyrinogen-III C-methyltransferase n=1 Tax=Halomonas sp. YLGW01 TaxID=2773308 RepID=UPI0017848858|nr:uroporphyrinogen-III C-methyltransferase [Halomonas sp. YLGW01]